MPRKQDDVNYTLAFKKAAMRVQDGEEDSSTNQVPVSTLKAWTKRQGVLAIRPHGTEVYQRIVGNDTEPVVAWIQDRLSVSSDQGAMTPARILEHVKVNCQDLVRSKGYNAQRRVAERALKAAWARQLGYEPVTQCTGSGNTNQKVSLDWKERFPASA